MDTRPDPRVMDTRALRYFVQVAQLKSFSRAAAHLRIAQPALSRQVRNLEDELGVRLLTRSVRGVQTTEAGALLLERAEVILDQIEQTRLEVAAEADEPSGRLTFAVTPAAGPILVPPLVERCEVSFPKIALRVVEGLTGFIHDGLLAGRFDLGLLLDPPDGRILEIAPLLVEPLFVIGPAGHSGVGAYGLRDLEALPLILPSRPNALRLLIDQIAVDSKLSLNIAREVNSMMTTKALVRRGLGYTIMSYGSVHDEVTDGVLGAVPIGPPEIGRRLVVAMRADPRPSRAGTEVVKLIQAIVRDLVTAGVWRGTLEVAGQS